MSQYIISENARKNIIDIYQFGLKQFGTAQADKYFDELFSLFNTIAQNPEAFPKVDHVRKGYRKCNFKPNTVFYKYQNGITEIHAIIGRQDIDSLFNDFE